MTRKKQNSQKNDSRKLSIQVSLSGFSFCILDLESQQITSFKNYQFEANNTPEHLLHQLMNVFDKETSLQEEYSKVEIIYNNELYAFVPQSLYDPNQQNEYLKYSIKTLATDFIAYDELEAAALVNVFIPYANINNFLFERFGAFDYHHTATLLVKQFLKRSNNKANTEMFAFVDTLNFYIIAIKNGVLQLCNTFVYDNADDFLYYLLFSAEQLGLDPESFQLYLAGAIKEGDACHTKAFEYIRNVTIIPKALNLFKYAEDLKIAQHKELIFTEHL